MVELKSNFKNDILYFLRKRNRRGVEVSFLLKKSGKISATKGYYEEIHIQHGSIGAIQDYCLYFYKNGGIVFNSYTGKVDEPSGHCWLMLPSSNLISCGLGSLFLSECYVFKSLYYPNLSLSNLTLSPENDNPINKLRRNRLYEKFGYKIEEFSAIYIGINSDFVNNDYGFEIISLKGYPANPYKLLGYKTACSTVPY